jgi:hypothetical protein
MTATSTLSLILHRIFLRARQFHQLLAPHSAMLLHSHRSRGILPDEATFPGNRWCLRAVSRLRTNCGSGRKMDQLVDFKAAFLDETGALIQTMPVQAESLTIATSRAGEIASKIEAADFYITSVSAPRPPVGPPDSP